jgi:sulfite reductase (NADPH) flavoprotein alpha-component
MTISIWRYSHFILAFAASLFLIVASITGAILAIEPISQQVKAYATNNLDQISLSTTTSALSSRYDEVFSIEVEKTGFIKASVLTQDMESLDVYVDATTGESLGTVQERHYIFDFATNLHRSLFLKSTGRFFVGLISFLLILIAFTGLLLLLKRQGGFKGLFTKVQKDDVASRYHVIFSRLFFIPILIIAVTGVYLSAERFGLLPDHNITHQEIKNKPTTSHYEHLEDLPFFKQTKLSQIRKVNFPFSNDLADFVEVALQDREVRIHQTTGQIVSSAAYPFVQLASQYSWNLHTGDGTLGWALVLLLASLSILFFIYTGAVMAVKRLKKASSAPVILDKDTCDIIILVGSETGTAYDFALRFYNALLAAGKKVYVTELNSYSAFAKARQIIIFTATYGEGEAPTNARKFEKLFTTAPPSQPVEFAVVGLGSLEYPDYCKFAVQIDTLLQAHTDFQPLLPLYKINNASAAAIEHWVKQYSDRVALPLTIKKPRVKKPRFKKISFKVIERTPLNVDDTFIIRLQPHQKTSFASGDLLTIFPDGTELHRQYSIARIGGDVVLSVKKHPYGKGSSYLYQLQTGDYIKASVQENKHFHLPKKTTAAIFIANGTGIAPFLGMLQEDKNEPKHLFWGGKTSTSFGIYDQLLQSDDARDNCNDLSILYSCIHKCYSQQGDQQYVQDLVAQQKELVLNTIQQDGVIMICGSLAMQHSVLDMLEKLLVDHTSISLDQLQHKQQLKMDCY